VQTRLIEVAPSGRCRQSEVFAADRLGDAVARLYERYADLLPDGPARTRAAVTARSAAIGLGPVDLDCWRAALAPAIELIDRRTMGFGCVRGAQAVLQFMGSFLELVAGVKSRFDDILALRPDAFLLRMTNSGTDRASGGAFERQFIFMSVFGSDGLVVRIEGVDADRDE